MHHYPQYTTKNAVSKVTLPTYGSEKKQVEGKGIAMDFRRRVVAMGWTVRGSVPSGDEIFCTSPDWPWVPPSLLHNGYRIFPGVKRPELVFTTYPSNAEIK